MTEFSDKVALVTGGTSGIGRATAEAFAAAGAKVGRSEEVAAAVLYLASDAAKFVTGIALPVAGRWTAQ